MSQTTAKYVNLVMTIPSYWGRKTGWKNGDIIYDHPTTLGGPNTLSRALKSLKILEDKDFRLVLIAAATNLDLADAVDRKLAKIAAQNIPVKTCLFGNSQVSALKNALQREGRQDLAKLISSSNYPNIRNLSLIAGKLLGADAVVLIDDDELFTDPQFVDKVRANLALGFTGFAGYYHHQCGGFYLSPAKSKWEQIWGKVDAMNRAFAEFIAVGPKLKLSPFAFGGNMVIQRDLFKIPFDPKITRGEDIDYIVNARLFGHNFYLDNTLSILHSPPSHSSPKWQQLRQDIVRFVYQREKIRQSPLSPEDFDPYPGPFLKNGLDQKIKQACQLLSEEYQKNGKLYEAKKAIKNMAIASRIDCSRAYCDYLAFQGKWQELMEFLKDRKFTKDFNFG